MNITKLHNWLLGLCLLVAISSQTFSQVSSPLSQVEPYLEQSTAALAQLNLDKISYAEFSDWLAPLIHTPITEQIKASKGIGGSVIKSLQDAGVSKVYVSLSLVDLWQVGVVAYFPCRDVQTVEPLLKLSLQAESLSQFQVHTFDGLVVFAHKTTWSRIASKPNSGNTELLQLLKADDSKSAAVAVCVPEALRKEVADVWPNEAPANWPLKFSPKELMNDLQSIQVTVDSSAKPAFAASLNTSSPQGAERFQALFSQLSSIAPNFGLTGSKQDNSFNVAIDTAVLGALQAATSATDTNNLRQMLLSIMEYEQFHRVMPPRETRNKDGKSLLSWRVHVLPYLDEQELYDQFHLNEPWDSPHNSTLISKMPAVFTVDNEDPKPGKTRMELPMMEGGAWFGEGPQISFAKITDGAANTVAVMIAPKESAVIWTQPRELELSAEKVKEQFFGEASSTFIAMFDGSVRRLERTISPEALKAYITCAGNDYQLQKEE